MELTVQIPDDIASHMTNGGADLSRHALEALADEEYRQGHLHKPDLRRLLVAIGHCRYWSHQLPRSDRPHRSVPHLFGNVVLLIDRGY
jgi:hypothetical protein